MEYSEEQNKPDYVKTNTYFSLPNIAFVKLSEDYEAEQKILRSSNKN